MDNIDFFDLNRAKDLFDKCLYERSKLINGRDKYDIYRLINLIFSLNHLPEWIIADNSIDDEIKKFIFLKFFPYEDVKDVTNLGKNYESFIKDCKLDKTKIPCNNYQKIIRLVCNHSKHIKKIDTEKRSHPGAVWGTFQFGQRQYGEKPGYYYSVTIDNKDWNLIIVLDNLIDQWKKVF